MEKQILLIDKPAGLTSFGVVARVRRKLTQEIGRKIKVGHAGTLDPFATGLLILLIGKATKKAEEFLKLDKVYEATIRLGAISTTGDPEGEIQESKKLTDPPLKTKVETVLKSFVGKIEQIPPSFSAIKINGQRAYKLARRGEKIQMPTRKVQIYEIKILEYSYPILKISCHVSSGTYIRTLAEDIGKKLGVGAYTTQLRRLKIGDWTVKEAKTLEELEIK